MKLVGVCGRNSRFVDVFCFFSFSCSDGEAGVRKTAILMMSPSVQDLQKDFFVKVFWGSRDSCGLESGAKECVCIVEKLEVSGGFL